MTAKTILALAQAHRKEPSRANYVALAEAVRTLVNERDLLKAEAQLAKLTRVERECLYIGREIHRAAGELPDGYEIEISVERGYGGVKLVGPEYQTKDFSDTVDGLSHCIKQAIDAATEGKS